MAVLGTKFLKELTLVHKTTAQLRTESIFLTITYGLFFSHHYTLLLSSYGPLWAAFRGLHQNLYCDKKTLLGVEKILCSKF